MGKRGIQPWNRPRSILQRFFEKVGPPDANGCWPWLGAISTNKHGHGGYGNFFLPCPKGGRKWIAMMAHVFSYEFHTHKQIPPGLEPDHKCRNRACVNYEHLEPVTRQVNILRGESPAAVNAKKTHCNNGHPLSGNNLRIEGGRRRCRQCARAAYLRWEQSHGIK